MIIRKILKAKELFEKIYKNSKLFERKINWCLGNRSFSYYLSSFKGLFTLCENDFSRYLRWHLHQAATSDSKVFLVVHWKQFWQTSGMSLALNCWPMATWFGLRATSGFPLRLENLEKMGRHFPVREKSGNFEQTGKVRENHTKYWKTEEISEKNYLLFFSDI